MSSCIETKDIKFILTCKVSHPDAGICLCGFVSPVQHSSLTLFEWQHTSRRKASCSAATIWLCKVQACLRWLRYGLCYAYFTWKLPKCTTREQKKRLNHCASALFCLGSILLFYQNLNFAKNLLHFRNGHNRQLEQFFFDVTSSPDRQTWSTRSRDFDRVFLCLCVNCMYDVVCMIFGAGCTMLFMICFYKCFLVLRVAFALYSISSLWFILERVDVILLCLNNFCDDVIDHIPLHFLVIFWLAD